MNKRLNGVLLSGLALLLMCGTLLAQDSTDTFRAWEFGISGNILLYSDGKLASEDYLASGAYHHIGNPVPEWSVSALNSRWALPVERMLAGQVWAAYRLNDQWSVRLALRYGQKLDFVSQATVEYKVRHSYDYQYWHIIQFFTYVKEFPKSAIKSEFGSMAVLPGVSWYPLSYRTLQLGGSVGLGIYADNFKIYLDLPTVESQNSAGQLVETTDLASDQIHYEESKVSVGFWLNPAVRAELWKNVRLEAGFFFEFGTLPVFQSQDYTFTSTQTEVDLTKVKINNDNKSAIRDYGLSVGLGFNLF